MAWSTDDVKGLTGAWHYVNHYLGTPDKWLLPKDPDLVGARWSQEREGVVQDRRTIRTRCACGT
ncbi:hypothetical protein [Streptomyces sp. NPDC093225]|uniref:hypothetical protein n=1 Tax=Streptomyces sp. NPDC093225 TaxID=3366034 RepID=UPI00380D4C25